MTDTPHICMISNRQCLVLGVPQSLQRWTRIIFSGQLLQMRSNYALGWQWPVSFFFLLVPCTTHCISVTCDAALSWDVVFYSEQRSFSLASSCPTETVKFAWISWVQNKPPKRLHKIARKLAESKSVHWGRFLTAFMLATIGVKFLESRCNISQMKSTLLLNVPG